MCPFCGFRDPILYKMQFHIESFHTPDSPFVVEEEKAEMMELIESEDSGYVLCTEETCGEPVLRQELQTHLDMHLAERVALTESGDDRPRSSGHPHSRVLPAENPSSNALVRVRSSRSRPESSPPPTSSSASSSKAKSRRSHSSSAGSNSRLQKHRTSDDQPSQKKSKSKKTGVST